MPLGKPKQVVVCAAVLTDTGLVICSARHHDPCMNAQIKAANVEIVKAQGFIDQFGTFLGREQARDIAAKNGQIIRRVGGDHDRLYSENLY